MKAPERILFAVSHSEAAGAQALWADLAMAFIDRGHPVTLAAIYASPREILPLPAPLNWNHLLGGVTRNPIDLARAVHRAAQFLKAHPADVIFTALPAANVVFPLGRLLAGSRAKVFTSHHTPVQTYSRILDRLDGWIGKTRAVNGMICVSRAVRDSLNFKSSSYRTKSFVIHNALSPTIELEIADVRRRNPRSEGRVIVAAGRLAPQKNYPVLIHAMAKLPDARLRIIGGGPDEAALKSLAEHIGVSNQIDFLGHRPRSETLALLCQSDVFLQPSLFEGHSLAIVEASKLGLPLVVSAVPSQIEAVTRADGTCCALLHAHDSPSQLASRIKELLDDQTAFERYQKLSHTLGEETSFQAMFEKYCALVR